MNIDYQESQIRQKSLKIVADYCHKNTNIDVYDIKAYFGSVYIKIYTNEKLSDAVTRISGEWIKFIHSVPGEYFLGIYSKQCQDKWDRLG